MKMLKTTLLRLVAVVATSAMAASALAQGGGAAGRTFGGGSATGDSGGTTGVHQNLGGNNHLDGTPTYGDPGRGGMGTGYDNPGTSPLGSDLGSAGGGGAPGATSGNQGDSWRYRWHQGHWWYYTAENRWMVYGGNRWVQFTPGMTEDALQYSVAYPSTDNYGYTTQSQPATGLSSSCGYTSYYAPSYYGSYYRPMYYGSYYWPTAFSYGSYYWPSYGGSYYGPSYYGSYYWPYRSYYGGWGHGWRGWGWGGAWRHGWR